MVGLVEDIVDADAWNELEHPAHREGMGGVQIYEPMALGVNDTWGISFVSTSWKSVAPVSLLLATTFTQPNEAATAKSRILLFI